MTSGNFYVWQYMGRVSNYTRKTIMKTKIKHKQQITVYMTPELKVKLRDFCAKKNMAVTDFVEALISRSLKRN